MSRGEVANGVNCYMKQHGVTKEEAVEELSKMARDNYKIIMEEFLTTIDVPRPVLVRCLNVARMIDVFCKEGRDEFTNPHGKLKDLIASLFLHPLWIASDHITIFPFVELLALDFIISLNQKLGLIN